MGNLPSSEHGFYGDFGRREAFELERRFQEYFSAEASVVKCCGAYTLVSRVGTTAVAFSAERAKGWLEGAYKANPGTVRPMTSFLEEVPILDRRTFPPLKSLARVVAEMAGWILTDSEGDRVLDDIELRELLGQGG